MHDLINEAMLDSTVLASFGEKHVIDDNPAVDATMEGLRLANAKDR